MKLQRKTMLSLLLACASIFTGCAKMDLKADRFTLELGEDPATAKLKKKSKEFMLEVKDTTAPKITLKRDIQIQVGEALEITDVIAKVTEKSKEVNVKYSDQEHVIKNEKKKISGVFVQAENNSSNSQKTNAGDWVDDVNSVYYNQFVSTNEVVPGNGSAFFLHCSNGRPTAGCVSVPQSAMVQIMQTIQPGCLIVIDTADGVKGY